MLAAGMERGVDCVLVPAQAPMLLNELRSTWGMQPPSAAMDASADIAQHV